MRVLTVIQHFYPTLAGAEKFAQALAEALQRRGVENLIVTGRWDNAWKQTEVIHGLSVHRHSVFWIGNKKKRRFAGLSSMIFLFVFLVRHRSAYDVILVHQAHKGAFIASVAGRLLRKPTVVVVHCAGRFGDLNVMRTSEFGIYTRFMINSIRRSDAFVAICSDIQRELEDEGFKRISMIHDGIEVKEVSRTKQYDSISRFVTLARLHPQKGIDILLNALALLDRSWDWHLELCGDGPEKENLERLSHELNLEKRVHFRGHVRDIGKILDNSDLFILPSRGEGMGLALLEAMNAGLPCIVTRVSGFVDIVNHGENGFLVDPENPEALAAGIRAVAADGDLRSRLGREGRRTVIARFSIESTAARYHDLFLSLLRKPELRNTEPSRS